MSWLVTTPPRQAELTQRLKQRVAKGPTLVIPGAHDALTALIARDMGFEAVYVSGAAHSASRGLPDVGIITSTEVAQHARDIVRATALPVVVDIDTGYGSPLAAARAARELADMGVAAVQVEDQALPKACGHLTIQRLATPDAMTAVLRAIREAAPSLYIIGRTDARTDEGVDGVVRRGQAMLDAGADMIFPEALRSVDEFRRVGVELDGPLIANMTEFGKSPALTIAELGALGYAAALFPASTLRVAALASRRMLATLLDTGTTASLLDDMLSRDELYRLLSYSDYATLDDIVSATLVRADDPEQDRVGAAPLPRSESTST